MTARRTAAVLAALLLLGTAGCASTTGGTGAVGRTSGPARPTDFPTDFPATSDAATTAAAPSPPPSAAGTPVPPPKECANAGDCKVVKSWELGGHVVAVLSAPDAGGGIGASVLALARGDQPVDYHVFDGETPGELLCRMSAGLANCALADYVGAHAATVYPVVVQGDELVIGEPVGSDTPGLHVGDLDGDGLVDAWGLQNNYKPDYASGHVQWQTWKRAADGFTSTGCGPLTSGASAPAAPTSFLTGSCDTG